MIWFASSVIMFMTSISSPYFWFLLFLFTVSITFRGFSTLPLSILIFLMLLTLLSLPVAILVLFLLSPSLSLSLSLTIRFVSFFLSNAHANPPSSSLSTLNLAAAFSSLSLLSLILRSLSSLRHSSLFSCFLLQHLSKSSNFSHEERMEKKEWMGKKEEKIHPFIWQPWVGSD